MVTLRKIRQILRDEGLLVPYITLYSWSRRGLLGTPEATRASRRGVERLFNESAIDAARVLAKGLAARNARSGGKEVCTLRQARKRLLAAGLDVSLTQLREVVRQYGLEVTEDGLLRIEEAMPVLLTVFSKPEVGDA